MNFLDYLKELNLISEELYNNLSHIKDNIINYIYKNNLIEKQKLIKNIESYFSIEYVNVNNLQYDELLYSFIDESLLNKYNILVISIDSSSITIATDNPLDYLLEENISFVIKDKLIVKKFAFSDDIINKRNEFYRIKNSTSYSIQGNSTPSINNSYNISTRNTQDSLNVVNIVNSIINNALSQDASDIHIEPIENTIRLRYRIDGELIVINNDIKFSEYENIISRIKVLSNLDPSEKRKSQDGRISGYESNGKKYDIRVSSMCTIFGEKIVLRILEDKSNITDLGQLGFNEKEIFLINRIVRKSNGIFLVTGETGSGKTTTLYTILNLLNQDNRNICTIEDPVESIIKGINQVQVNELAQITFSSALKTFLRQDPNIIMVGEIRDLETAEVSLKASSTGHLVFSTIHTNNATATISRLRDIGILPYQVNENLKGVLSQKLVRKLCPYCKKEHILSQDEKHFIKNIEEQYKTTLINDDTKFYENVGCDFCNNTGYKGRLLVCEILFMSDDIKYIFNNNKNKNISNSNIRCDIYNSNQEVFIPIEINGISKAIEGITTINEIMNKVSF